MKNYSQTFFDEMQPSSRKSAELVVPCLMELLSPRSVLDIGCGSGEWLSVFGSSGVSEIMGVDGEWAKSGLSIPQEKFVAWDLEKPVMLAKKFDLAMSVEVGEHLPDAAAGVLVESLARHSGTIVFSAAVPGQYGTLHQNEQFVEYWAKRFLALGYIPVDCLRPLFWNMEGVEYWYAQNMVLYTTDRELVSKLGRSAFPLTAAGLPYSLIHPTLQARNRKYLELLMDPVNYPMSKIVPALPQIVGRRIRKWLSDK